MWDKVISFLAIVPEYPNSGKIVFILWLLSTVAAFSVAIVQYPGTTSKINSPTISTMEEQLSRTIESKLSVNEAVRNKYSDLLDKDNSGIAKLLASPIETQWYPGGGTYYSFVRRTNKNGFGSDIQLENGVFLVGFAGLDFGYFLPLGQVSIRKVLDSASPEPPLWLDAASQEAWKFMWTFRPPNVTAEVRKEQKRESRAFGSGSTVLAGYSYLLRSINYRHSDILVALYVDSIERDNSANIVWRILSTFSTPDATGPEPD